VKRHDRELNAVVARATDQAMRLAEEADLAIGRVDPVGPLHGVPMTLKDAHAVAGMPTTAGFTALRAHIPVADSQVVRALKRAGAIIFGRTNVPEGLLDYQTANEIHGRTNNPWDVTRTPGGSSGGAAAALAAGMTSLEIGSDLAGSLRLPAHFCGVYAMMPSHGTVSTVGHMSDLPERLGGLRLATSIGPMARSLGDLELALSVIATNQHMDPGAAVTPELRHLRLAFASRFPGAPVATEIADAVTDLASRLERDGAVITECLPDVDFRDQGRTRTNLIDALRRASDPAHQPAPRLADWLRILDKRAEFVEAWDDLLREADAFLCPVAMVPAFPHTTSKSDLNIDGSAVGYWSLGRYLTPFNLVGAPAIAMPLAMSRDGLPIGLQIVGARGDDRWLLAVARAIEPFTVGFQPPPGYAS
jgi:amidase